MSYYAGLFAVIAGPDLPNTGKMLAELQALGLACGVENVVWDAEFSQVAVTTTTAPSGAEITSITSTVQLHVPYASLQTTAPALMPAAITATTAALPACTYANGSSGVGATLTANANGVLTVDTRAVVAGDVLLVKNQASEAHNGLYVVDRPGTAGATWKMTRHAAMDAAGDFENALVWVNRQSATNSTTLWGTSPNVFPFIVGTSTVPFVRLRTTPDGSGASGQVAYWSATSTLSGESGLTWDAAGDTLTITGSADDKRLVLKGHSSQTANLLECQSNAGAILLLVAADGTILVRTDGTASAVALGIGNAANRGFYASDNFIYASVGGTGVAGVDGNAGGFLTASDYQYKWTNGTITGTLDTGLARSAAAKVVVTDGSTGAGSLVFRNAGNIEFGTTTGTKIGTATTQKIGFWNTTPVVQPAGIVDADGTLADITTKFNDLLSKLESLGMLAVA